MLEYGSSILRPFNRTLQLPRFPSDLMLRLGTLASIRPQLLNHPSAYACVAFGAA